MGDCAGPWGLTASGTLQSLPSGTWDKLSCHIKADTNKHAEYDNGLGREQRNALGTSGPHLAGWGRQAGKNDLQGVDEDELAKQLRCPNQNTAGVKGCGRGWWCIWETKKSSICLDREFEEETWSWRRDEMHRSWPATLTNWARSFYQWVPGGSVTETRKTFGSHGWDCEPFSMSGPCYCVQS